MHTNYGLNLWLLDSTPASLLSSLPRSGGEMETESSNPLKTGYISGDKVPSCPSKSHFINIIKLTFITLHPENSKSLGNCESATADKDQVYISYKIYHN